MTRQLVQRVELNPARERIIFGENSSCGSGGYKSSPGVNSGNG